MNWPRIIAGVFAGSGAIVLIIKGNVTEGVAILMGMLGFFVGEHNGYRKAQAENL